MPGEVDHYRMFLLERAAKLKADAQAINEDLCLALRDLERCDGRSSMPHPANGEVREGGTKEQTDTRGIGSAN